MSKKDEILYYVPLKTGGIAAMTMDQIDKNLDKIAGVKPSKNPKEPSRGTSKTTEETS